MRRRLRRPPQTDRQARPVFFYGTMPQLPRARHVIRKMLSGKIALLLLLAACPGCATPPVVPHQTHTEIAYCAGAPDDPLRRLDISTPGMAGPPKPVAVLIHGGAWAFGDKAGSDFAEPKTRWFLNRGCVVVRLNYRLSPAVRHPAHITDVAEGLAWIRAHAAAYGGDPDKLILLGHSAGAHLAALAAVDHDRLQQAHVPPASIRAAILLDGAGYDIPRQIEAAGPWLSARYHDAFSRDVNVQREASPALKISANRRYPPCLIFHIRSRADSKIQAEALADALANAGSPARVITAEPGETHLSLNREFGSENDRETRILEAELTRLGLITPPPGAPAHPTPP